MFKLSFNGLDFESEDSFRFKTVNGKLANKIKLSYINNHNWLLKVNVAQEFVHQFYTPKELPFGIGSTIKACAAAFHESMTKHLPALRKDIAVLSSANPCFTPRPDVKLRNTEAVFEVVSEYFKAYDNNLKYLEFQAYQNHLKGLV